MSQSQSQSPELPGWTCPAIDHVAGAVRAHVPEPLRSEALEALEELRLAHVQLRAAAAGQEPERAAAEVDRLERRIAALAMRARS